MFTTSYLGGSTPTAAARARICATTLFLQSTRYLRAIVHGILVLHLATTVVARSEGSSQTVRSPCCDEMMSPVAAHNELILMRNGSFATPIQWVPVPRPLAVIIFLKGGHRLLFASALSPRYAPSTWNS